jgi:hypothetical protein
MFEEKILPALSTEGVFKTLEAFATNSHDPDQQDAGMLSKSSTACSATYAMVAEVFSTRLSDNDLHACSAGRRGTRWLVG